MRVNEYPQMSMFKPTSGTIGTITALRHTTEAMDTYPRICSDVGLNCESCTEGTARNLAKVCKGLHGKVIGQLFVQIHTNPACAKMHAHFTQAYLDASIERMPVMSERRLALVAVA
jgi:hypothetical protein